MRTQGGLPSASQAEMPQEKLGDLALAASELNALLLLPLLHL